MLKFKDNKTKETYKYRIKMFIELKEDFYCKGVVFKFTGNRVILQGNKFRKNIEYYDRLKEMPTLLTNEYLTDDMLESVIKYYEAKKSGDFITYLRNSMIMLGVPFE